MSSQGPPRAHGGNDDSAGSAGMGTRAYSISSSMPDGGASPARACEDGADEARQRAPMSPEVVQRLLSNFSSSTAALEVHLISTYKNADTAATVLATNWRGEQAMRSSIAQQLMTDCKHLQMLILDLSQSIANLT